MQEHKTIQNYLETVSEQIRWKRARSVVVPELKRHLEDQRDAFAAEDRQNAEELAVEEMGDPVTVGTELDAIHRPRPQWGLLALTMLLALCGALLQIWLTAPWAYCYKDADPFCTLTAFVLGCGVLLLCYFLDYTWLGHHGRAIYLCTVAASLLALLVSPRPQSVSLYAIYLTLCYPVVYALWLYTCRRRGWTGLLLAIAGGIPLAAICLMVPRTSSLLTLMLTGFVLLMAAGWKDWFGIGRRKTMVFVLLCGAVLAFSALLVLWPSLFANRRLAAALHPELDPTGAGYQANIIRKVLDTSQWLGQGTWSTDVSAHPFEMTVPSCSSDAFLTTIIYKLGWAPFLAVVLAFAILAAWMLRRCLKHKSQLGSAVSLAVVMALCAQALYNVMWNLGYPLFAAEFPLIVGNTNTIINMGLIGLALSVFRGESIARDDRRGEPLPQPRYRIKISIQKY